MMTADLTRRELDVLRVSCANKGHVGETARALGLSVNTVKTHLANIYLKLGAVNAWDACEKAGLVVTPKG